MKKIIVTALTLGVLGVVILSGCAAQQKTERQMPGHTVSSNAIAKAESAEPISTINEPTGVLALRDALALALTENPELAPFSWQARADEARLLQASVRHNPDLSLQIEDVAGTGEFSGVRSAQATLQLSQVIELGGKRDARKAVALKARDVSTFEYELKRVEVLGEVTQRFIQVVADQHALDTALTNRQLAEEALRTVEQRVKAGKASALEEKKAQVALARGNVLVEGARHELSASRKKLAAAWGSKKPAFEAAQANLFERKPIPSFEELAGRISKSPEIARWATEKKLREAEIKLADARRIPNVTAAAGVRRLEGPDDNALVFSLSMPLQIFDRGQGARNEARALLGKTEAELKAAEVRIGTVLVGLYEEMLHEVHVLEGLQDEILPKAKEALALAMEGYSEGRFSYLEVLDAQRTLFEINEENIRTAASYHKFVAEMERLIGQPFESQKP